LKAIMIFNALLLKNAIMQKFFYEFIEMEHRGNKVCKLQDL